MPRMMKLNERAVRIDCKEPSPRSVRFRSMSVLPAPTASSLRQLIRLGESHGERER